MSYTAFPMRNDKKTFSYSDLNLACTSDNEDDAIIVATSSLDFDVYDRVLVLNSKTYSTTEYNIK
jgi:hypothetical protein